MDATSALWVAEVYLLFIASLMMMGGALGDRYGRRRVLRIGIYGFALSSIACASADGSAALIAARAAQGLSAALTMPSSLALLNACFPVERRGQAVGSWTAMSSMMLPLGPLVGGAAVDFLSWQWIFLINLPICAMALIFLRGVPKPPYEDASNRPLDGVGILGVTCGLGALVFGLLEGARLGFDHDLVVATLVAAVVVLPATLLFEMFTPDPLLPVRLFKNRRFLHINLQTLFFFIGLQGTLFLLPFYYIQILGFSALQAGACGLPISVAIILLSRPVGRFLDRHGPGRLLASAPFMACFGIFLLTQVPAQSGFVMDFLPAVLFISVGLGLFIAPVTMVALNAAGDRQSGLASAVNNTMARVAGLISVALMGVFLTSGFSDFLVSNLVDLGLNERQLADVLQQQGRLAALIAPSDLNGLQLNELTALVNDAFRAGFSHALLFAAGAMAAAGLVGVICLRKIKMRLSPESGSDPPVD